MEDQIWSSKNCIWFWFPTAPSMSVTLIWLKRKRKARFEAFCCSHCWKRWVIWTGWIYPWSLLETIPNNNHRGQQQQRWQPEEVQRGSGLPSPPLHPMVGSGGEENSDYLFVYARGTKLSSIKGLTASAEQPAKYSWNVFLCRSSGRGGCLLIFRFRHKRLINNSLSKLGYPHRRFTKSKLYVKVAQIQKSPQKTTNDSMFRTIFWF